MGRWACEFVNGAASCILGLTAGGELRTSNEWRPLLSTVRSITVFGVLFAMVVLSLLLFALRPLLPMFSGHVDDPRSMASLRCDRRRALRAIASGGHWRYSRETRADGRSVGP